MLYVDRLYHLNVSYLNRIFQWINGRNCAVSVDPEHHRIVPDVKKFIIVVVNIRCQTGKEATRRTARNYRQLIICNKTIRFTTHKSYKYGFLINHFISRRQQQTRMTISLLLKQGNLFYSKNGNLLWMKRMRSARVSV